MPHEVIDEQREYPDERKVTRRECDRCFSQIMDKIQDRLSKIDKLDTRMWQFGIGLIFVLITTVSSLIAVLFNVRIK